MGVSPGAALATGAALVVGAVVALRGRPMSLIALAGVAVHLGMTWLISAP
jgi:hypothetical protein